MRLITILRFYLTGKIVTSQKLVCAENYPVPGNGKKSVHAEGNALKKFLRMRNAPRKIDILVIRFSKSGKLGMSRPCRNCLMRLTYASRKFGFCIKNIYYSNAQGTISVEKFPTMLESDLTYVSSGFNRSRRKCK